MANLTNNSMFSLELEQSILSTLLQFPDSYVEISFVNSRDFSKVNAPIFSVIQQIIESKGRPDAVVVSERLKSAGITIDGIDVGEYVSTLVNLRSVDPKNVVELAGELKKKTLIRTINEGADRLKREVNQNSEKSGREIVSMIDKHLGDSLLEISGGEHTGTNLLEVIPDLVEEMGNQPESDPYIHMPYENWHRIHGPLHNGIYFFVARNAEGKSTLKLDICRRISDVPGNKDKNLKILWLDTELQIRDQAVRWICGNIGAPYHLIDGNQWRRDTKWCPLIRAELDKIRGNTNKNIWFEPIGNMSGSNMANFIKAWFLKNCGRNDTKNGVGNRALIVYDYFKMTNKDKAESSDQEFQAAYEKSEILKDVSEYCGAPILSSIQANRSGIANAKSGTLDDASIISTSDRLGWLPNYMGIWRKRTHEEMIEDSTPTELASTHKLIDIKKRYFGVDGYTYDQWIRLKKGKEVRYVKNYMNFNVNNFAVEDKNSYDVWLRKNGFLNDSVPNVVSEDKGIV